MVVTLLHTGTQFTVVMTLCITCTSCKKNLVRINQPTKTSSVRNSGCVTDRGDHGWWDRSACHWTYLMLMNAMWLCCAISLHVHCYGMFRLVVDYHRTFPACRFGDSCLFIHPNCKFDASCRNARCPFTHSCPRRLSAPSPAVPVIVQPVRGEFIAQTTVIINVLCHYDINVPSWTEWTQVCMYVCIVRAGSSLLWTHTLRPLYSRPIALTQEGRSQVDDVCECMCDWRVRRGEEGWVGMISLSGIYSALLGVAYCLA